MRYYPQTNTYHLKTMVFLRHSFIYFFLIIIIPATAQTAQNRLSDVISGDFIYYKAEKKPMNIEGNPYFNENWEKGSVVFQNGDRYDNLLLKYDIHSQRILFFTNQQVYYIPDPFKIKEVIIGESHLIVFFDTNKNTTDYFKLLYEGKSILFLEKYDCTIRLGRKSDGVVPEVKDKYRVTSDYYIKKPESGVLKVKLNEKDLPLYFENSASQLKEFAKKNKLKYNKEEDAIKIIEHYDNLVN